MPNRRSGERGVVGVNLALTIAFALFAVIELSRVVLAAGQINDRVKVIVNEIGPGSNVARFDEAQKLNETGRMAEDILAAAQPLSGQAQQIIDTAKSIDGTVSGILANAVEINATAKGINVTVSAMVTVVRNIDGDGSFSATTGGVDAIDKRTALLLPVVGAIQTDLSGANILGTLVSVDRHAVAICNGPAVGTVGGASCGARHGRRSLARPTGRGPILAVMETSAAARWRRLVQARLAEMERLQPGRGAIGAAFWDSRAKRFASRMSVANATTDPFYRRLRRATGRRSTVLDVGAGPGRFTLALAPHVAAVTAVDPSGAMLDICRREARRRKLVNVTTVQARWQDADVAPADVAFSSYVLPLVADAAGFLAKLNAAAGERAFLYLGAYSLDAVMDPLWRHFHGRPRKPGATYLDAIDVVRELGAKPAVEVVEVTSRTRFATVAAAAKEYGEQLCLRDTPEVRKELRGLLADWLVPRDGGFGVPLRTTPAAIISWAPG